jgi:hypothetical protein
MGAGARVEREKQGDDGLMEKMMSLDLLKPWMSDA